MNSVEGILSRMVEGLEEGQADRKDADPESYAKIAEFIAKTRQYATGGKLPFTILLDDPSGNSFIQNPYAPNTDPYNKVDHYIRTKAQLTVRPQFRFLQEMGYASEECNEESEEVKIVKDTAVIAKTKEEEEAVISKLGVAKKEETEEMKKKLPTATATEKEEKKEKKSKKHKYTQEEIKKLTDKLMQIKQKEQSNYLLFNLNSRVSRRDYSYGR